MFYVTWMKDTGEKVPVEPEPDFLIYTVKSDTYLSIPSVK